MPTEDLRGFRADPQDLPRTASQLTPTRLTCCQNLGGLDLAPRPPFLQDASPNLEPPHEFCLHRD